MKKFNSKSCEEIMTTVYKPIEFVVDNLLAQGLYILAGAPKVGKSWLALDMCLSIAKGEKVLGQQTTQGTALYLCLEDSYVRIQNRLYEITDEPAERLHFVIMSESIGNGLEEEYPITEKIFAAETEVIMELVSKGNCVIVGRCADFILKNKVKTLNVFINASFEKRQECAIEKHNISEDEVEARLKKYDKKRADYYNSNTNKKRGDISSYDMCLDSGKLGYEMCAEIIADTVKLSREK